MRSWRSRIPRNLFNNITQVLKPPPPYIEVENPINNENKLLWGVVKQET
jgi:hypothetical protein